MHLRKDSASGHLVKANGAANSHLRRCGASGPHPLCYHFPASAPLRSSYTVTISGFPNICYVGTFNGVWTLSYESSCTWSIDIDAYHRVALSCTNLAWVLSWNISSGGANGLYVGLGPQQDDPTTLTWQYNQCFEPLFCWGLCTAVFTQGAVSVS